MFVAYLAYALEVGLGRDHVPAVTRDGLLEKGGDVPGGAILDGVPEGLGALELHESGPFWPK